jgi:hypothetical protein
MQVPVYGTEVPIEDWLKRCWLMQRTSQAIRIRRGGVHTLTVPEARLRVSTTGTKVTDAARELPLEVFVRREDAERFIEEVRGDDPDVAAKLRVEERELEAGGPN